MNYKFLVIFCFTAWVNIIQAQDEVVELKYTLPELPYAYDALEPYIDSTTMRIHYSKHHKGYLDNLNKTGAKTIEGVGAGSIEELLLTVDGKNPAVRNNGGGYYNHSLFWRTLSPKAKKEAAGKLALAIKNQFGSQDSLQKLMNSEGAKRFGSGWVWLLVTPLKTLAVASTGNQDNPIMNLPDIKRGIPVLGIDVWEHAYYLKHQNKRGDYLKDIWNVVHWGEVEKNYEAALKSPLLAKIDKSSWGAFTEFDQVYRRVMLPGQSGDYTQLKLVAQDLEAKAELLASANIPASFQNTDIRKVLKNLSGAVKDVVKSATKKPKDEVIKDKLMKLQAVYKELEAIIGA